MKINASLINLFHVGICQLWLHAHGIRMEHNSDQVYEGKLTGELSYPDRAAKYTALVLPGAKIDYYDAKNAVVLEVRSEIRGEG